MVKIRLMRIGAKKHPYYRIVVVDEQKKRTGAYLELLGTYDPLTEPKQIILKQDRIDTWVKNGAKLSDGFLRIIGKAKQRPPRKPKKDRKEVPAVIPATEQPKTEEVVLTQTAENQPEGIVDKEKSIDEGSSQSVKPTPAAEQKPAEEKTE